MNDDSKVNRSQENIPNLTNELLSSDQETHQEENLEIAELKKQIHELKALIEMQKDDSSHYNTTDPNDQNKKRDVVTFRDIQRASSIHSVPSSNKRHKNQMFHYYTSHEAEENERTLPRKLKQPLEVRYTNMESKTKKKKRYLPTEETDDANTDTFERFTHPTQAQSNLTNKTSEVAYNTPVPEQDNRTMDVQDNRTNHNAETTSITPTSEPDSLTMDVQDNRTNHNAETTSITPTSKQDNPTIDVQDNPANHNAETTSITPTPKQDSPTIDVQDNLGNQTVETTSITPTPKQDNATMDVQNNLANQTVETTNSTPYLEQGNQTSDVPEHFSGSNTEQHHYVDTAENSTAKVETQYQQDTSSTIMSDQNSTQNPEVADSTLSNVESNNESLHTTSEPKQKKQPENETLSNTSTQISHQSNDDKKSVFGYIWNKIK